MKKKHFLTVAILLYTKLLFSQTPFIGEIRLFAGSFAPAGWAFCDGSLLAISEHDAFFSIIGTTYGGDGTTTFALPDLRGRVPIGVGGGQGLTNRIIGEKAGVETITLTNSNLPLHSHIGGIMVNNANAKASVPTTGASIANSGILSGRAFLPNLSYSSDAADVLLQNVTTSSVGSAIPVSITRKKLGLNYIISLFGIYPSPN